MEKLVVILLLASIWNLGRNPTETDRWASKTKQIDRFGRETPLVEPVATTSKPTLEPQYRIQQPSAEQARLGF